jgi:hypothetical protein
MKQFLLCVILISALNSSGQLLQDVNGRPYLSTVYEEYEGSPLLFNDWVTARVITTNGNIYDSMLIDIDLYGGAVLFRKGTETYNFTEDVSEIFIVKGQEQITLKKGAHISKMLPTGFYQIIGAEPLFMKHITRHKVDMPAYSATGKKYKLVTGKIFYGLISGELQKISLNKINAEKFFKDKWKALDDYAQKNSLSFKTEEGWLQLIRYYDTI